MARPRTDLTRMIETLHQSINPATPNHDKPDTFTIKQPHGTRERVKSMAKQMKVPLRDLIRACFEHGLAELEAEFQRAAKRAAREAAQKQNAASRESTSNLEYHTANSELT